MKEQVGPCALHTDSGHLQVGRPPDLGLWIREMFVDLCHEELSSLEQRSDCQESRYSGDSAE